MQYARTFIKDLTSVERCQLAYIMKLIIINLITHSSKNKSNKS